VLSGATRVAGLVGSPRQVGRSLSPAIHNAAYAALGLDWVYVGFPMRVKERAAATEAIRGLGRSGVAGFNVTMPHKLAAAAAVDRLVGPASMVGSVNTVQVLEDELVGWDTDGPGLVSFLMRDARVELDQCAVLILGAGGSARSVVAALAAAGAQSITVLTRNPQAGLPLEALVGQARFRAAALGEDDARFVAASDVIVNATPVGQEGEAPLIPLGPIRSDAVVVDLISQPRETALVRGAAAEGAKAYGGLGMLVHQAALAFEILTGTQAPIEVMGKAAHQRRHH
jgi:shikimate dehydrogenase